MTSGTPVLFERLLALSSSERRPEEDLLTEVVAALLRHDPRLFWTWLKPAWPDYEPHDEVEVATQVRRPKLAAHGSESRIDLVFSRRRGAEADVAYVESKVASGEGFEQLQRYADHLRESESAARRLLVYVTREFDPKRTPRGDGFAWTQLRWHDLYHCLESNAGSALVAEARALMRHLRMDQSQTLTPLDLLTANELPRAFTKLVETLAQVENSDSFRRLSGQQRYVGPHFRQLGSHSRLVLSQKTTHALWGSSATEGLWLFVGFEMNQASGIPLAAVFVETPSELIESQQREVERLYEGFEKAHGSWIARNEGALYRQMVRQRPLSDFLGDDAVKKLSAFFDECLAQLAGPVGERGE